MARSSQRQEAGVGEMSEAAYRAYRYCLPYRALGTQVTGGSYGRQE